jgi:hypothetical protein
MACGRTDGLYKMASAGKRKHDEEGEDEKECVRRKWKRIGQELLELSKSVAYDEFRRFQGLRSRKVLGMKGESTEECEQAEKRKRECCGEIGSKASHMVVVINMERDWKAVGWLHWKKAFAVSFIDQLFVQEAESLMMSAAEVDRGGIKQKSILYGAQVEGETSVLHGFAIHEMVMREIVEKLVAGPTVVRENIFSVDEGKEGEENGWRCRGVMSVKAMNEINTGSKGSHEEPIAMVIPIEGSLIVETNQQYKKHVGRPRKGKQHVAAVGDIFFLHWRQVHIILCDMDPFEKKAKWIILAVGRKVDHLMY